MPAHAAELVTLPDGRVLSYLTCGVESPAPGKTLLHFHGYMSSRVEATMLDQAARALGLKVVAFDRAGYGLSSPEPTRTPESAVADVEHLLQTVLPPGEKVIVMGVSGG